MKKREKSFVSKFLSILTLLIVFLFVFIFFTNGIYAQESKVNNFSIGYSIGRNDNDFSIGLTFTSPFIFNVAAIRINGYVCFNQFIDSSYNTWFPYYVLKIGLLGSSGIVNNNMRFYGEGGLVILFANENVSSKKINYGGYGLFGFEFFINYNLSYFIELGSNGLPVLADKLISSNDYNRKYFNGFFTFVGLRFYF
ncbi:MAG: hypothetical protein N3A58_02520 [Spirochaetes bacterium]|nr:hypothetical protein [Spirochaetota bacterium]